MNAGEIARYNGDVGPLPPIPNPHLYQGLFVYDFGSHVSVGYTAAEIVVLRHSPSYEGGSAYQIYRVDDRGTIELKGVQDVSLALQDCFCFLRHDEAAARSDFDRLVLEADSEPLPTAVEARLQRSYGFEPPHLTVLTFPAWVGDQVAGWLGQLDWQPGDEVATGLEALRTLQSNGGLTIASATLASTARFDDRTPEQVLATTHLLLQR